MVHFFGSEIALCEVGRDTGMRDALPGAPVTQEERLTWAAGYSALGEGEGERRRER